MKYLNKLLDFIAKIIVYLVFGIIIIIIALPISLLFSPLFLILWAFDRDHKNRKYSKDFKNHS